MPPKTSQKPPARHWDAELLRCTVFASNPQQLDRPLWDRVTGKVEPTQVLSVPQTMIAGNVDGNRLVMQASGLRSDIVMQPAPEQVQTAAEYASLGRYSDAMAKFRPIVDRFLQKRADVVRIAFGSVLLQGAQSVQDGKVRLLKFLPAVKIKRADDVDDVLFQINRRRKSKANSVKNFYINRLAKWSAVQILPAYLRIEGQGISVVHRPLSNVLRLELDMNTPSDWNKPLPKLKLQSLFRELCDSAIEISEKGDIP
jgi:hypothetical protein